MDRLLQTTYKRKHTIKLQGQQYTLNITVNNITIHVSDEALAIEPSQSSPHTYNPDEFSSPECEGPHVEPLIRSNELVTNMNGHTDQYGLPKPRPKRSFYNSRAITSSHREMSVITFVLQI